VPPKGGIGGSNPVPSSADSVANSHRTGAEGLHLDPPDHGGDRGAPGAAQWAAVNFTGSVLSRIKRKLA
jgi:hypothetical protein